MYNSKWVGESKSLLRAWAFFLQWWKCSKFRLWGCLHNTVNILKHFEHCSIPCFWKPLRAKTPVKDGIHMPETLRNYTRLAGYGTNERKEAHEETIGNKEATTHQPLMNHTAQKRCGRRQEPRGVVRVYLESISLSGTTQGAEEYTLPGDPAAMLAHVHFRSGIDRMPGD